MFTNKHVVIAFIVAPILAVITYFGVDSMVSEKPQSATAGASYKLASRPNCKHQSGMCMMANGDVKLNLQWVGEQQTLLAESELPLQGIKLAVGEPNQSLPKDFVMTDDAGLKWSLPLGYQPQADELLHLVMSLNNSLYFGESTAIFLSYDTSYHKDFREEAIR